MSEEKKSKKKKTRVIRAIIIGVVLCPLGIGIFFGYKFLLISWVAGDSREKRLYALQSDVLTQGNLSDSVLEKAVKKGSTVEEKKLLCIHLAYASPPFSCLTLSEYIIEDNASLRKKAGPCLYLAILYASDSYKISKESLDLIEKRLIKSLEIDDIKYSHEGSGIGDREDALNMIQKMKE